MDTLVTTALALPVVYFLVFKRMQTQVRQLQALGKTLQEREAEYRGIVEDQTELICWISPQGKITFLNAAVSKYTRDTAEMMIGKDYLSWFFAEDVPAIQNQVSCLTLAHPIATGEYRQKTASGDTRWFLWTIRAIFNPAGELIRYQSVGRDTTDNHRASIELQEARDGLELKVEKRTLEIETLNQALRGEITTRKNTEYAFRLSEFHLQQLFSQIPAIFWNLDKDLNLTSLQGSRLGEFQSQFRQLLQFNLQQAIASGDIEKPEIKAHLDALQGAGTSFELKLGDQDYLCTVEPFRDPNGMVVGCLGIALDITLRKRSEGLIRMHSVALEAAADGIMITDRNGTIQWGNPALIELTGYALAELIGQTPALFNSGTHPKSFFATLWDTILSGGVWRGEILNRHKNATRYIAEQTITPVRDEDGLITHFVGILQDITARKNAEAESLANASRLMIQDLISKKLNRVSPDYYAVLDTIVEQLACLIGDVCIVRLLSEDDLTFEPIGVYSIDPSVNIEKIKEIIANYPYKRDSLSGQIIQSGVPLFMAEFSLDQISSPILHEIVLQKITNIYSLIIIPLTTHGRTIGTLTLGKTTPGQLYTKQDFILLQNLTEMAALAISNSHLYNNLEEALENEQSLRQTMIQSEKYAAIGRMMASITHEINNPLQTIKNCLYLTRLEISPSIPLPHIEMAAGEVQRLTTLVAQLREIYRPNLVDQKMPIDLVNLIAQVHSLVEPHLQSQHVKWHQKPIQQTIIVMGLADQIKQVMINLSLNAIEAMQPNGGCVSIEFVENENQSEVGIQFIDTGIGIPEANLPRLFEPLFTTKPNGLGLGLPISYDIIKAHGGRLTVESRLGEGATFTVWLPLASRDLQQPVPEN